MLHARILCSKQLLLSLISGILLVAKDSILKNKAFSLLRYFKAWWVQVDSLRNGKSRKRLRKHQSSNTKKCEVFPVPGMLIILAKNIFSVWGDFLFHKRREVRVCRLLDSPTNCFFSTVEDGLPFLKKKKKKLEMFDLNTAQWHVHEKGLDDISFKCLLSVPNKTVTVTFLGCCSLGYSLLITSQTFVKTLAYLGKIVSLTKP